MATRGTYRKYSDEDRRRAVELAREVGSRRAAAQLGFPSSTIARWLKVASSQTPSSDDQASSQPVTEAGSRGSAVGSDDRSEPKGTVARRYTPSEKARALEYAAAHGVSAAANKLGMSRYSIYDWRRKQQRGDIVTTGPSSQDMKVQRDREILGEWKKHPGLGPSQICNQLRRRGIKVSTNTVRRVMEDAGYRTPKVKRHEHDERFEAVRPNHLWHFDFVHRHINKASTFTLILLDDHSRFVVGHGVDDAERSDLVIQTFEAAVERHGRPELVMTDRGSAFWSWRGIGRFTRLLEEMGIDQIAVRDKQVNGKLEVFNKNLAKELFDVHRFYDLAEMKRRLAAHLAWYNHQRTHHALGGLVVPADRYYGRVDEVMAHIEAGIGHGPDLHAINLRDRRLDLFRIVLEGGSPEVWLMGRRLLSLAD